MIFHKDPTPLKFNHLKNRPPTPFLTPTQVQQLSQPSWIQEYQAVTPPYANALVKISASIERLLGANYTVVHIRRGDQIGPRHPTLDNDTRPEQWVDAKENKVGEMGHTLLQGHRILEQRNEKTETPKFSKIQTKRSLGRKNSKPTQRQPNKKDLKWKNKNHTAKFT